MRLSELKSRHSASVSITRCTPSGMVAHTRHGRLVERFGYVRMPVASSSGILRMFAPRTEAGASARHQTSPEPVTV